MAIFRPREKTHDAKPAKKQKPLALVELAKNDNYCISKFPALPAVLNNTTAKTLNGYSDSITTHALVVSEDGVFVWAYQSTDATPLTIEFPSESANGILPLAVLTKPSSGAIKDPGIAIINASSGAFSFYESVQHSPALGLIAAKDSKIQLPINTDKGEFITMAENVEPAGIIVVSSWKRVILVTLRDHQSKPSLSLTELLKPPLKLLPALFGSHDVNTDIASIRSSHVTLSELSQEILIQEQSGLLHIISISGSGRTQFTQNLAPSVEQSVDGLGLHSTSTVQFLDTWKVHNGAYLALCRVADPFSTAAALVLVTAQVNQTGVLVYGAHKSSRYTEKEMSHDSEHVTPRLYLPYPETTGFIVYGNLVIMTDLDYLYIQGGGVVLQYKPRWEDVVSLAESVAVIGCGYENKLSEANPAVVLLTSNAGVLRVERFSGASGGEISPVRLVKLHIEQAVFYAGSSAVDFDLKGSFADEAIHEAILQVVGEIMASHSAYLPSYVPTTLLEKKTALFQNLIEYCQRNFQLSDQTKVQVVFALEKTQAAWRIWQMVDPNARAKAALQTAAKTSDLRAYFTGNIDNIGVVFTAFLSAMEPGSSYYFLELIAKVLYSSVLLNEQQYARSIAHRKSWIFDTDLLVCVEKFFAAHFCNETVHPPAIRIYIHQVCQALYYFTSEAIGYMAYERHESLAAYTKWYRKNRMKWIRALLANNMAAEAVELVESYRDFASLAAILENGDDKARYAHYFDVYGYEFAAALFDYYITHDKVYPLLTGFPQYSGLLERYLSEKADKVAHVAWIRKLIDGDFDQASRYLLQSVKPEESQSIQELKYSLAKLSAIASNSSDLFTIETKLITSRIQQSVYHYITDGGIKTAGGEEFKFNSFLNYINEHIDSDTARAIFGPSFNRFIRNITLDEETLIDYLTLIKPTTKFNGFSYAFRLASLLPDEEYQTKKIWSRLLTIADSWDDSSDHTDEFLRRRLVNSTLYKTPFGSKQIAFLREMGTESGDDDESELDRRLFGEARALVAGGVVERVVQAVHA